MARQKHLANIIKINEAEDLGPLLSHLYKTTATEDVQRAAFHRIFEVSDFDGDAVVGVHELRTIFETLSLDISKTAAICIMNEFCKDEAIGLTHDEFVEMMMKHMGAGDNTDVEFRALDW